MERFMTLCAANGPRARRSRRARLAACAAGAAVVGLLTVAPAYGAPARASTTEDLQYAEAVLKPSVVFVQTVWTGYLVDAPFNDVDVGAILSGPNTSAPKFSVVTTASAWVANADGYIVTAGHAVDDQPGRYGGRALIVQAAVDKLAGLEEANGTPLSSALINRILDYGYANWKVEGLDSGSPPDRVVTVYPTQAAFGITATKPLTASVVSVRGFSQGDVALLKVTSDTPLPALELAPGPAPATGTPIVTAGYPGPVSENVDPSSEPSMKDGTVSGQQTVGGVPFIEMSAATAPGSSGAAVANQQGQVVGTVSWQPGRETQAFNFMTATSTVHDILASNGVSNALSPTDRTYRAGLTDYFAGRYHAAAQDFDQVLALEPGHAQAQAYKRLAIIDFPKEKVQPAPTAGGSPWRTPLLVGVGLLVVGLLAAGLLISRRQRRGSAVTTLTPGPHGGYRVIPALESPEFAGSPGFAGSATPLPGADAPTPSDPRVEDTGVPAASAVTVLPAQRTDAEKREGGLRLFVTYAREDRPLVEQLRAGLQRLRHEVWVDDRLSGGNLWWDQILLQLRQCDAIVVAVSPALLESQASTLEREYAGRLGKPVLPVCVRPVRPELTPPDLAAVQMVDYTEPDATAAFELADALTHLPSAPELPEPLPEPPLVPLSYLSDLTARVRAPSLSLDEQLALVSRLRSALGKDAEHQPAMELLLILQRREDLYHEPAREIAVIVAADQTSHAEPVHAEPVHAEPVHAEPVHAGPVHVGPAPAPASTDADPE
ncbi:MAG: TIR domain-containing protein [Kineosporiaceae bacterium]